MGNRNSKKQDILLSLEALAMAGVLVTVCKTRKAKKQTMRVKGSKGYVVGGSKPGTVAAVNFGA